MKFVIKLIEDRIIDLEQKIEASYDEEDKIRKCKEVLKLYGHDVDLECDEMYAERKLYRTELVELDEKLQKINNKLPLYDLD